jgi:hypothetical protein
LSEHILVLIIDHVSVFIDIGIETTIYRIVGGNPELGATVHIPDGFGRILEIG